MTKQARKKLQRSQKEVLRQCKRLEREENIKKVAECPKCKIPYPYNRIRMDWKGDEIGYCNICGGRLVAINREL